MRAMINFLTVYTLLHGPNVQSIFSCMYVRVYFRICFHHVRVSVAMPNTPLKYEILEFA